MICPLATADVRKEYESMQRTIACFRTDKCPQTSASLIVIADRADFCADIADVCAGHSGDLQIFLWTSAMWAESLRTFGILVVLFIHTQQLRVMTVSYHSNTVSGQASQSYEFLAHILWPLADKSSS